ncbi:MAG: hypothetical protein QXG03_09175 [Halalkalicoccus sp.]
MNVDGLILNLKRLSHELSGSVADRERSRIETRLEGIERCPACESAATFEEITAPPPVDAVEYESDALRRSALSDYYVGVRFAPCGHEVDLETIDGLSVHLRDAPLDVDYDVSPSVGFPPRS